MNWPHGPAHWLFEPGLYIVTASTYRKLPHLNSPLRLDFFQDCLFKCASEFGWNLRAWAVLANHYHFVAASPPDPRTLRKFSASFTCRRPNNSTTGTTRRDEKCGFNFGRATSPSSARI